MLRDEVANIYCINVYTVTLEELIEVEHPSLYRAQLCYKFADKVIKLVEKDREECIRMHIAD